MKSRRLIFRIGPQYYALVLEPVIEIVGRTPPEKFSENRSAIRVRQDLVPCFSFPWPTEGATSIVCHSARGIGAIVVDEVCGIFRKKDYTFHPSPISLQRNELISFSGILELESLKIKAYELHLENFINLQDPSFEGLKEMQSQIKTQDSLVDSSSQIILEIPLAQKKLAMCVKNVERIIPFRKPSPISGLPSFASGLINVEGSIVPLIDLQARLENPAPVDVTRIIVFISQNQKWGLSVPKISSLRQIQNLKPLAEAHKFGQWFNINHDESLLMLSPDQLVNF